MASYEPQPAPLWNALVHQFSFHDPALYCLIPFCAAQLVLQFGLQIFSSADVVTNS
jgi:hypothetical protein